MRLAGRIELLMPAFDCGDDCVGIGGPCEGLRHLVGLLDEAVDGGLKVDALFADRPESSAIDCRHGAVLVAFAFPI